MALGILFVSLTPGYAPDLMSYLFGSILFVPAEYLYLVFALDLVILLTVTALFKELRAVVFDEEFAEVMNLPVELIFQVLLVLASLAVVTLIRVVGVILGIALFTIPPAIARQWSDSLVTTMIAAVVLGAGCTTAGLFLAYWLSEAHALQVPTGPLIIMLAMVLYGASSTLRVALASRRP
jgi:zinc transport system permease protein